MRRRQFGAEEGRWDDEFNEIVSAKTELIIPPAFLWPELPSSHDFPAKKAQHSEN